MTAIKKIAARVGNAAGSRIYALVGKPSFWVVFILLGTAWPIARTMAIQLPPPLPVLGTLPDFQFKNQYGEDFGSEQLKGRVWVANFIFTRCPTECPRFTKEMFQLQHRGRGLGQYFHLVSFSVDAVSLKKQPTRLSAQSQPGRYVTRGSGRAGSTAAEPFVQRIKGT